MRRERRKHEKNENSKNILYIGGSILGIGIIAFVITFIVYGNIMEEQSEFSSGKISSLVEATNNAKTASSGMGKTVEESKQDIEKTQEDLVNTTTTTTNTNKSSQANGTKSNTTTKKTSTNKQTSTNKNVVKEVTFIKPVEGEICKGYAKDNLLYSKTLEEWTTHLGIDIKAEKATVVKASADGKIKSIKNDPRYGLSIIIEHQDGYETLYSNLLSSEFVKVGEEVKQGQSIGTVGNTATFEILDEPHLHFEISKNGENLDTNQYIK